MCYPCHCVYSRVLVATVNERNLSVSRVKIKVLYCTVLYCIVLYGIVLYRIVLYCTVLYCTVLYCTVLYCTVLYCTVPYCTVLYCTVLYCTVLSVLPLQRGQQVPGSWTWCMQGSLGHSWDTQRTSPSWKESQGLAYRPLVML